MKPPVLLDTGPLVAFLNRRDRHHKWAVGQLAQIEPPLLSCEAVLSEACFILRGFDGGSSAVLELLQRGLLNVPLRLGQEVLAIKKLLERYANLPISLADACLVRMSELYTNSVVLTLDSDFRIYRKQQRHIIPTLMP